MAVWRTAVPKYAAPKKDEILWAYGRPLVCILIFFRNKAIRLHDEGHLYVSEFSLEIW